MAWDSTVVDNVTVDYAADHNEQTNQIKARLTGSLGAATPNNFIIVNAAGTGATPTNIPSEYLGVSQLGTPTLKTLQDWEDGTQSGGRVYGGVITDATGGLISVSAMKGMIKIADFTQGVQVPTRTKFFDYAGDTNWGGSGVGTTLTDNSINYIYIDYNSGTPKLLCTTDRTSIRKTDQFNIGRVFKNGTDIEVLTSGINLYNRTRLVHERWIDTFGGISRANGIIPAATGASPSWSLGVMYAGSNRIDIPAVNCAGAGTFSYYYTSNSGTTWTEVTGVKRLNYTQYNDITSGLVTIASNRYTVHWMYVCPEGEMYMLYGQSSYQLSGAQAATAPTVLPNYLSQWCLLAAKIIVSYAGVIQSVTPAWTTLFPVQNVGNHSDLSGLDYESAAHTGFSPDASPVLTGTATTPALKLTTGAGVGRIPTSDATGVLSYLTPGANTTILIGQGTGATPAWGTDIPTAVTIGSQYIYRASGTDVPLGDGGTGISVAPKRTVFLSCSGGVTPTTYGDGGFVTTETNPTGASPLIFNLKTVLMDTTGSGSDRHHEWTAPLPANWDGSTVTAIPYIMTKGIAATNDTLVIGLQACAIKHGDAISALTFANTATSSIGASAYFSLSATAHGKLISNVSATSAPATTTLTIGGSAAVAGGDLIQWRMNRPGFDTYASGASVFGWLITYGTNKTSDEA